MPGPERLVGMTVTKASLQSDLTGAIRAQDKVRAGTLRMALTAITVEGRGVLVGFVGVLPGEVGELLGDVEEVVGFGGGGT